MALVVEDGTGISGAESYASVAEIDAYWAKLSHNPLSTTWDDATEAVKEGAAREATAYLDAHYGGQYRGIRQSYDQGVEWPRYTEIDTAGDMTPVLDRDGNELPDIPRQLKSAVAELAARAVAGRLVIDPLRDGPIKRDRVGDVETEYFWAREGDMSFANVDGILAQIIGAPANWYWR